MEPVNLFEYEAAAREKLSQGAFDFIAGGADDEITLAENRRAFERIQLLPRHLVDVSCVDLSTQVLGQPLSWPVMLAPVATQKLAHPDGEVASARAAAATDTAMVLSTFSTYSIEDVGAAGSGLKWLQLYFQDDLDQTMSLVQRAEAAGYRAICVTVDAPRLSRRERDLRNQLRLPQGVVPANFAQTRNLSAYQAMDPATASQQAGLLRASLTWKEIDWLRSVTRLPVLLKGVLNSEDARIALDHGIAGIVVSNHGGRQLDGTPASIAMLPDIVEAVGGRIDLLLDSGIRRGTDVLKALALGAKVVLLGRPYVWGLAVDGEAGVRRVIETLRDELTLAMALAGCPTVATISPALIR